MAWFTSSSLLSVVCQVEELQEEEKTITREQLGEMWSAEWPAGAPVILQGRQIHYIHCDHEHYQPQQFTHCELSLHKVMRPGSGI